MDAFKKISAQLGDCFKIRSLNYKDAEKFPAILMIDSDEGFSNYTSYLAYGLSKYRNITLYGWSREAHMVTGAYKEKRIKFYWIREKLPKGHSTMKGIARVFLLFFILFRVLTKIKYSTVHIQEHLPTFFLFIPFLKLRKKQIFWELHDINVFRPSKGIRGKLQVLFLKIVSQPVLVGKYADVIIVHAYSLKKHLEEKGLKGNKIHVLRLLDYRYLLSSNNNYSLELKPVVDFQLPKAYVLFFGSIAPWKGLDVLISASRLVSTRSQNFNIVIAGRSFYEDEVASPLEDSLTKQDYEHIHIINKYITDSEIPDLVNNAAFLILPYTSAFQYSASGVIPLAYTFSKPVIVSDVPSLTEYVNHGKTGFIFEAGNSSQLAEYIIELLENKNKCIEMGTNGYQKLLEQMCWDSSCRLLNELYDIT